MNGFQFEVGQQYENTKGAYEVLAIENGIPIKKRWAVRLKGNGDYEPKLYTDSTDKSVFLHGISIHNYKLRKGLIK